MTTHGEMLEELRRVVAALGPYRADVVLAGGFVPLVYRESGLFASTAHAPLLSGDIDLAVPQSLVLREVSLRDSLTAADYIVVLSRSTEPPVHYYQQRGRGDQSLAPFHVEFLAPLTGSETKPDGSSKSPAEVQAGVNAQLLRYLDLLMVDPIAVAPFGAELEFFVPNAAAFVVQKIHASERRDSRDKREKDFAYIYDVALLTRRMWPEVAQQLDGLRARFLAKWFKEATTIVRGRFADPDADGPRAVVRIMRDHDPANAPAEEAVFRVVTRFLDAIGL